MHVCVCVCEREREISFAQHGSLQNNMERNEFQTRTKLEAQLVSAEREFALAKKKLEHEEEERDKRREAWEQRVTLLL